MRVWRYFIVLLVLNLSACALQPGSTHQSVRYYDFGAPLSSDETCHLDMRLGKVTVSPALQGNRIWYRLSSDPYEPRSYAISLWTASPADLLRKHLGTTFHGTKSSVHVEVRIVRMELGVQDDRNAIAKLALNATVLSDRLGSEIESHPFADEQLSEASPAGAASAFARSIGSWRESLCHVQERILSASK